MTFKASVEIEIAKWLSKLREEKGISQEALALELGKGQSDIAKIENGSKKVSIVEFISWMAALQIPIDRADEVLKPLYESITEKRTLWKKGFK